MPGKGEVALGAAVVVAGATLAFGVVAAGASTPPAFRWFAPASAPSGWKHARLSSGTAVLSYPASLKRIAGDKVSISVARKDASGRVAVYLNSTPQEGNERLATWPAFRINHARGETDRVRVDGQASGLHFLGGKGSCVTDDYYTRVHVNHYREIACFVVGRSGGSVVVAAALESNWKRAAPLLERAISAYRAT